MGFLTNYKTRISWQIGLYDNPPVYIASESTYRKGIEMFTLNVKEFKKFDLNEAKKFVDYWSEKYSYEVKALNSDEAIDYVNELSIKNELSEKNIKKLLRWKDPIRLTEVIQSGKNEGKKNKSVLKVIEKKNHINEFRKGKMSKKEFKAVTENVFPNGFVWPIFLFHIARPFEYPIADQNVFRAFSTHKNKKISKDWELYKQYINYFFQISISSGIITEKPKRHEPNIKEIIKELKKVDEALFAFGQFLDSYGKR